MEIALLSHLTDLPEDCVRLLHGRGGQVPDLEHVAIDWFSPILLVTFYAEKEANAAVLETLKKSAQSNPHISGIVSQRRYLPGTPKQIVFGTVPEDPVAIESDLRYHLTLDRNQNHGFFLDMKSGREWVRNNAAGQRVLNLFAYTCSLSVAAIAGGAESVVNLDMASGALETGRANHRLNFNAESCRRVRYLAHDLFKTWGKLKRSGPFDLIIIDPPSNQPGSFVAEKDYQKIVGRLPELTGAESKVLACLNSPHLGEDFLVDLFEDYELEQRLRAAPGFDDLQPERGLKCLVWRPASVGAVK